MSDPAAILHEPYILYTISTHLSWWDRHVFAQTTPRIHTLMYSPHTSTSLAMIRAPRLPIQWYRSIPARGDLIIYPYSSETSHWSPEFARILDLYYWLLPLSLRRRLYYAGLFNSAIIAACHTQEAVASAVTTLLAETRSGIAIYADTLSPYILNVYPRTIHTQHHHPSLPSESALIVLLDRGIYPPRTIIRKLCSQIALSTCHPTTQSRLLQMAHTQSPESLRILARTTPISALHLSLRTAIGILDHDTFMREYTRAGCPHLAWEGAVAGQLWCAPTAGETLVYLLSTHRLRITDRQLFNILICEHAPPYVERLLPFFANINTTLAARCILTLRPSTLRAIHSAYPTALPTAVLYCKGQDWCSGTDRLLLYLYDILPRAHYCVQCIMSAYRHLRCERDTPSLTRLFAEHIITPDPVFIEYTHTPLDDAIIYSQYMLRYNHWDLPRVHDPAALAYLQAPHHTYITPDLNLDSIESAILAMVGYPLPEPSRHDPVIERIMREISALGLPYDLYNHKIKNLPLAHTL